MKLALKTYNLFERPNQRKTAEMPNQGRQAGANQTPPPNVVDLTGTYICKNYYGAVVEAVLKPFFFVSQDHFESHARIMIKL